MLRISSSLLASITTYAPDLSRGIADAVADKSGTLVRIALAKECKKKWGFLTAPQKYRGKRMTRRACLEGYAIRQQAGWLVVIPDPKSLPKTNWTGKPLLGACLKNAIRLHNGDTPFSAPTVRNLATEWGPIDAVLLSGEDGPQ